MNNLEQPHIVNHDFKRSEMKKNQKKIPLVHDVWGWFVIVIHKRMKGQRDEFMRGMVGYPDIMSYRYTYFP